MNHVTLIGRLSKDVDVRAAGETKVARTTVAVQRNYKGSDGNYGADFISVVAFGKTADFLENNFTKGKPIIVTGAIQTGSYTNKDGQKVYTTDIAADNVSFPEVRAIAIQVNHLRKKHLRNLKDMIPTKTS